jgi:hypothetical protein
MNPSRAATTGKTDLAFSTRPGASLSNPVASEIGSCALLYDFDFLGGHDESGWIFGEPGETGPANSLDVFGL